MKKYVIHMRKNSWSKEWVVRSEHDTLAEARDELKKSQFRPATELPRPTLWFGIRP